ncbi:MAG: AraC family transcriptional regulator [Ferruginibacter sp.]
MAIIDKWQNSFTKPVVPAANYLTLIDRQERMNSHHYQYLNKSTQRIVDGENRIYYSEMEQYYSSNAFRNFSIKLPVQGVVNYRTDEKEFNISSGQFLLISKQPGSVFFDSGALVKSICIDISEKTFAEAYTVLSGKKGTDLDNMQSAYFNSPAFFENICMLQNDELGKVLLSVIQKVQQQPQSINTETFFQLTESIILQQQQYCISMNALDGIKVSTRKEVLKRLLAGKTYIDENFLQNPEVAEIAKHANLSPFYFFRSFKKAFKISPYQYMFSKRLEYAVPLIQEGCFLADVAAACGFPDIYSFSKAFKKKYGYPPSQCRKKNVAG